jgi:hypothetical protein
MVGTTTTAPIFHPREMLDLEVTYNGQRLYYSPGYSSQLINMRGRRGAGYFTTYQGTNTSTADTIYPYPLSMITTHRGGSELCESFDQPNTSRYPNQVLNVSFRTPEESTARQYVLYLTYVYSALAEVDSSGQCSIIFS